MSYNPLRPAIDAELHQALWHGVAAGQLPASFASFTLADIPRLRKMHGPPADDAYLSAEGRVEIMDILVPGYQGAPDVPVLVLRPAGGASPRPAVVYTHNGGKLRSERRDIRGLGFVEIVVEHQVTILVVQIREAPENRHPAQVHDGYAGLMWAAGNAEKLGIDPARIALMGISGGGGIAAATALFARDHGGPEVSQLILLTPMLDDRDITFSARFEGVNVSTKSVAIGWDAMLGEAARGPDVDCYAAPSRAQSLVGMPPIYIETGSADLFRDESLDFATRAGHAGVPVELHCWGGAMHASELSAPEAEVSKATMAARHSYFRRIFRASGTGLVPNRRPDSAGPGPDTGD